MRVTAYPSDTSQAGSRFSSRVFTYFAAQVVTAAIGIFNGFVMARLMGPSQKGDYYLLTLLPSTLMVLSQLGLAQAFGFFSARGATRGLVGRSVLLAGFVSVPMVLGVLALVSFLSSTILGGLGVLLIACPLLTFPFLLNSTFMTGIITGRQASRWLALISIGVSLFASFLVVLFVGILGLGLWGAILAFVLTAVLQSCAMSIGAKRLTDAAQSTKSVSSRALFRYGLPFYPTSLTQFLAYRADVYLLAWLLADPSAPLGYYSLAVSMAELVFFLPNAISTFFFPYVAGATREEADRHVPLVSRVTLVLTGALAIVLVPVASAAIIVILPAFEPSLLAFYVLLPGVVAMSVSKVVIGYLSGLGQAGVTSLVSIIAFAANVVLNLLLIPRYGIVGAAAASLVSYTMAAMIYSVVAARLVGARSIDFWVPGVADVRYAITATHGLVSRITGRQNR